MTRRATVVKRAGLPWLIKEARAKTRKLWYRHPSLMRFLEDQHLEEWEAIKTCGLEFKKYESHDRPGHYRIVPVLCHREPFCIRCVRAAQVRRAWGVLERFGRCTPTGQKPRFIHIVQTAPVYADGTGWGMAASRDVQKFASVVWRALVDLYGEGMGASMSYQDFGERCFEKRHPHQDLTLNGWRLEDGKAVKVPRYDLTGKGRDRWDQTVVEYARELDPDAKRGMFHVQAPAVGGKAYYHALCYQVREMVDFSKLTDYSLEKQVLYYQSGKENLRVKFTLRDWHLGFYEYQHRLGAWGDGQSTNLHRSFGHLSKRSIGATQRVMGGVDDLGDVEEWERVFLDDVDAQIGRASPLSSRLQ
ncbi:MAG: hypothetical protein QOD77_1619 [Thermoplasmata archaeon]|jgi:hypothetical protein|nr:hypothetical protein [Thermoplasmata archaeon]